MNTVEMLDELQNKALHDESEKLKRKTGRYEIYPMERQVMRLQ